MMSVFGWCFFLFFGLLLYGLFVLVSLKDTAHTPRRSNRLREPHHGYWGLLLAAIALACFNWSSHAWGSHTLWLLLLLAIIGLIVAFEDFVLVHGRQLVRQWTNKPVPPDWEFGFIHMFWYHDPHPKV